MLPNSLWALVIVVVLVGLTIATWRINRPALLVAVLHNGIWAGAILLIGTGLIAYKEASVTSWLTLSCGIVFFNVGAWLARWPITRWWPWRRKLQDDTAMVVPHSRSALLTRRTLVVLLVLYGIAFAIYLLNIQLRFGLTALILDPASIRGFHGESYLESVPLIARIFLNLGPFLLVAFGYRATIDKPLPLWLRAAGMLVLAMTMLALLQRTNLFMGVLWLIAVLLTRPRAVPANAVASSEPELVGGLRPRPKRGGNRRVVLAVLGSAVAVFLAFQFVGGALHKTGQQALSTGAVSAPLSASGLTSPFTYYTAGPVAFLQLVDSSDHRWPPQRVSGEMTLGSYNPQTFGASTFAPILKAIPGAKPWPAIDPFIDTAVLTNVYTWLESYYRDFRVPGVIVGMLLLGLLISRLYITRSRSQLRFWIQSALLSTVFLATFVTKINNTLFLCELIVIVMLTIPWRGRVHKLSPRRQQLDGHGGSLG